MHSIYHGIGYWVRNPGMYPVHHWCPFWFQGFFRRCITQGMNHRCANEEKCDITPFSRNSCQFCRLKKCFGVGMSREGMHCYVVRRYALLCCEKVCVAMLCVVFYRSDRALCQYLDKVALQTLNCMFNFNSIQSKSNGKFAEPWLANLGWLQHGDLTWS